MDWLSKYHATIDCLRKTVTFQPLGEEPFTFIIIVQSFKFSIISASRAQILLDSGCEGYLASVMSIEEQHHPILSEVPVVQKYP